MDDESDPGDVFAIPILWGSPRLYFDVQQTSTFLFSELKHDDITEQFAASFPKPHFDDGFFALPDLSFGVLEEDPTPTASTESEGEEETSQKDEHQDEPVDNLWDFPEEQPLEVDKYLSWDSFEDPTHKEPDTVYITEAGPEVFDAALAGESDILQLGNGAHLIIKSHIYASSLVSLGLGRSSVLFSWNEDKKSFIKALSPMRISGCSGEVVDGLLAIFMNCGNAKRALQEFVDRAYMDHKSPGRIALADAVSTLLTILQSRLTIPASSLTSFLQLQALFRPAELLLTSFQTIVESVSTAESDEEMLSRLFYEIQSLENRADSMREILLEVLARVSRPFLDFVGEWMGIQKEGGVPIGKEGFGKSFVKVEDRSWVDEQGFEMQEPDFVLDRSMIPSFISTEDARMMFETGKSLRFLRTHHSDHPLARSNIVSSTNPPILEWKLSWQNIEQVEAKAHKYEKDLLAAIRKYSRQGIDTMLPDRPDDSADAYRLDFFGRAEMEMKELISKSAMRLNEPLLTVETTDPLSTMLTSSLTTSNESTPDEGMIFAPPISLTPNLSFGPIIAAQARIVNGTSMRLFFQKHNLREHLNLQRRFHLLGDGVFSSRLSHALFDPELETAERRTGVARAGGIMGLRLEGRDSWPPASSELRLALMGILTESYVSALSGGRECVGGYLDRKNELPGDLSFAVRDMSDEEIEKCKDSNSVEALDFLRLSYKPPAPLEAVITPLSLYKYDQLFKLLLRVLRMLFVVSQLFRDATDRTSYWQGIDHVAQRFRIEAHHFVSCVCGYFFDTGIDATWRILERKLNQIEERINQDADYATLGQHEGLDKLRDYHERVLDRILFALLLRKRQQPVMKLLEDTFALILQFAKHSRSRALGITRNVGPDPEVKELYLKFRRKVEVFITVCRGLSEKKGYGEKAAGEEATGIGSGGLFDSEELAEENTIAYLLARLEMSNYYAQPVKI